MSWLFDRISGARRSAPSEAPLAHPPPREVHGSLALAALWQELPPGGRLEVLDLGPPLGANVEFWGEAGARLHVGDLYGSLFAERDGSENESLAEILDLAEEERFDLVLAWDLFNYLSREEIASLADFLRRVCRPGALVFALVAIGKTIPAEPYVFRFAGPESLDYERRGDGEIAAPRWAPAEVAQAMPGFAVRRTFLLRHGVEEYLFARQG
ncbi:MAG TPA: hypothetical protein VN783_13360 [Thermoanaerobaculia bacterium]|nr:hypothetical protein [Thermoanaerobaculia bacterium]